MDAPFTFNEHGEYIASFCRPEQGPLRPSSLGSVARSTLAPPWAYLDHDALPYVTTADHRTTEGRIVPQGTACRASRHHGVVTLIVDGAPFGTIVLDGSRWVLDLPSAPRVRPEDAPELFFPA